MTLRFPYLACGLFLVLGVGACAPKLAFPAPATSPAEDDATQALAARIAAASARQRAILSAIQIEDGPRKGKAKRLFVREQVKAEIDQAERLIPAASATQRDVRAYEDACQKLEAAYLTSLLESTDPASRPPGFAHDAERDVLGSDTVDAKLVAWQERDPARPLVKFAVVDDGSGGLVVRVGSMDIGHVDIAAGPAVSAGLLRTAVLNGKLRVVAFENTSGGFRPGPLRNRITLAALKAVGYLPVSSNDLTTYDNPSGGYSDSKLMPPRAP